MQQYPTNKNEYSSCFYQQIFIDFCWNLLNTTRVHLKNEKRGLVSLTSYGHFQSKKVFIQFLISSLWTNISQQQCKCSSAFILMTLFIFVAQEHNITEATNKVGTFPLEASSSKSIKKTWSLASLKET